MKKTKNDKKSIKRFVVTCIDSGDSCDGYPRCLAMFKTRKGAVNYIEKDMENYEKQGFSCNYDDWTSDTCVWNMQEMEIAL